MTPSIPEVEVSGVPAVLPPGVTVLDVREPDEWQGGHIEGAQHIPLMQVPQQLADIPADGQVLVVCKVGGRSAQATEFLQAQGIDAVNVIGGMLAWQQAKRPMVCDTAAAPTVL